MFFDGIFDFIGVIFVANFTGVRLKDDIVIDRLYSVRYLEQLKNFELSEEFYRFIYFIYVEKGSVTVMCKNKSCVLKKGDIFFVGPNKLCTVKVGDDESNIVTVSFSCKSSSMGFFSEKLLKTGDYHRELILKIISEYSRSFLTPISTFVGAKNIRKENAPVGSEQLIKQYLCELLIMFMRNNYTGRHTVFSQKNAASVKEIAQNYMRDNIGSRLSLSDIARYCGTAPSTLSAMFGTQCGMGVIEYFIQLKTDAAKEYIRQGNYNITQISEMLGYSSIHYFSRQFKKITGMSPSEYSVYIAAAQNND